MMNELGTYLQGEVIQSSWTHFRRWLNGEDRANLSSAKSSRPGTASSADLTKVTDLSTGTNTASGAHAAPSDPRTLAEAHRSYLQALNAALFATNSNFIGILRQLLSQVDHFVALFSRLQTVWEGLDLQEDDGVVDAFSDFAQEERDVLVEMDQTRDSIEARLVELVDKIREVEKDNRTGSRVNDVAERLSDVELSGRKFVPWKARTVDRLIMKLDSLAGGKEEERDALLGIVDGYDDE